MRRSFARLSWSRRRRFGPPPAPRAEKVDQEFLCPAGAEEKQMDAFHGLCSARKDAGCASPAATTLRPVGAKNRERALTQGSFRRVAQARFDRVTSSRNPRTSRPYRALCKASTNFFDAFSPPAESWYSCVSFLSSSSLPRWIRVAAFFRVQDRSLGCVQQSRSMARGRLKESK